MKLPLRVTYYEPGRVDEIVDADNQVVIQTDMDYYPPHADGAEFIVKRVNGYDDLLTALKGLLAYVDSQDDSSGIGNRLARIIARES